MAWITADVFRWHLDYFRSPGLQFYRLALVFVPCFALFAWLYSIIRQSTLWKWEPYALAILVAGACLFYEPRASLVTAAVFLACSAAGSFTLRRLGLKPSGPLERITFGAGVGAGLLMFLLFLCGLARLFYAPVFLAILALPLAILWRDAWRGVLDLRALLHRWRTCPSVANPLVGIAVVFAFAATVCALMTMLAPSVAFDPVAIHLPSIQFYAQTHALRPVPGIDYSYYPQGFEMLWTLAYSLAGQAGAQMLSAPFFALFLLILFRLARECGLDQGASVLAAVCAATLPFVHWSGSIMKNDLALAFFELLTLYAFVRWLQDRNFRWILASAFFLAQAFSLKHVALFGAIPLALLIGYAAWRQPKKAQAAAIVVVIVLLFSASWTLRAYLLTGNPVAPARLIAATGTFGTYHPTLARRVQRFIQTPWTVVFHGLRTFESPLPNPAGILFFAFAPLALLGGRVRPQTGAQIACLVFAACYFLYWSAMLIKVRYAIAPFALLAVLAAAWMKSFYESRATGFWVKLSLIGVETYCLLIALMGLMIIGINGPQLAYFAGRLDKPGYLRAAMQAYGAVEFIGHNASPTHAGIFGVENLARAYAPDPFHFQSMWCPDSAPCSAARVVVNAQRSGAEYLILPENGSVPAEVLAGLGHPDRLYHDDHFSVYDLARNAQALR